MVKDSELRLMAKKRVEFKTHLAVYVIINIFLIALNLITSPTSYWFPWVTGIWGFGVVLHGIDTYLINTESMEEREYQKLKAKQK